eukprot:gene17742-biopygen824
MAQSCSKCPRNLVDGSHRRRPVQSGCSLDATWASLSAFRVQPGCYLSVPWRSRGVPWVSLGCPLGAVGAQTGRCLDVRGVYVACQLATTVQQLCLFLPNGPRKRAFCSD